MTNVRLVKGRRYRYVILKDDEIGRDIYRVKDAAGKTYTWTGWSQQYAPAVEDGYWVDDYFDDEGHYLGPDGYGVEPIWTTTP